MNSLPEEEVEAFYVVLELKDYDNMQNTDLFSDARCRVSRLDTDRPVLQVNDKLFVGEYEDVVGTYVLMDEVYEKRRVSLREKEKPIENISVNKEEEEGEEEDKSKEETGEREETQHENETEEVEEQEVLADVKFRGLARKKIVFNRIISEVSTGKKVQSKKTKTNDQKPKKKDKKEKKNKKHKKDKKEKSSKSTEKPKKKQKISKS